MCKERKPCLLVWFFSSSLLLLPCRLFFPFVLSLLPSSLSTVAMDKGLGYSFQPPFFLWVENGSPLSTHRFDGSLVPLHSSLHRTLQWVDVLSPDHSIGFCKSSIFNIISHVKLLFQWVSVLLAFAYQGKDIVFKFIIEYSSLRDFGP